MEREVSEKYDKYFTLRSLLNNDYRKHTGKKPHQCDVCQKALTHESSLNTHLAIHTREKPYQCDRCVRAFRYKGTLNRLDSHNDRNLYRCEETITKMRHEEKYVQVHTDQGFKSMKTSEAKLTAPLMEKNKTTKGLNCEMCDESFIQKTNMIAGKKTDQGIESRLRPTCPSPTFSHPFGIGTVKMEEKIPVCAECHGSFDTKDSLDNHYQTCKEVKPVVKLETVCSQENYLMEDSVAQHHVENTAIINDQKIENPRDEQCAEISFLEDLFLVKGNSN